MAFLCQLAYGPGYQVAAMQDILAQAIIRLSDPERLVFTLYYYEELTTGEIALLLGEREAQVSQLHSSALSHLHAQLEDLE